MEQNRQTKKKIPHYINDPIINAASAPELKLKRPNVNFINAILFICSLFVLSFFFAFAIFKLHPDVGIISSFFVDFFAIFIMLFTLSLKQIIIWLVRFYQRYALSETRLRCRFNPSCSDYMILSLEKYGLCFGLVKGLFRLYRCKPPLSGDDFP